MQPMQEARGGRRTSLLQSKILGMQIKNGTAVRPLKAPFQWSLPFSVYFLSFYFLY